MKSNIQTLQILLCNQPIGLISHLPGDKNLFTFDPAYVDDSLRPTLSLSFKDTFGELITEIDTTRTRLSSFFSNLLPEGLLREYLAKQVNINPQHEFYLLEALGQDLPGALKVQRIDQDESLFQNPLLSSKDNKKRPALRFSLAGIQLKFSAIEKAEYGLTIPSNGVGGGWIVKLPHSVFRGVPENEYSMMELARRVGIEVPAVALYPIEKIEGLPPELKKFGDTVFAIKRFDRTENGEGIQIEDFAQVFGVYPEKKYRSASYRNIVEVLAKECKDSDVKEFIRRFVFNALIGNGDMHLKNWSLIYRDKRLPSLAPAYDFVSTILYLPEDKLALNFAGNKDFQALTLDQFKRFAAKANLSEKLVLETVQETVQSFAENWRAAQDLPLSKEVREAISNHLKTLPFW